MLEYIVSTIDPTSPQASVAIKSNPNVLKENKAI